MTSVFDVEVVSLAKDVAVFCQFLSCNSGQHFFNDKRNVASSIFPEFRRNGVGAQERGNRLQRRFPCDALDHPQNFQFIFKGKSIAGFRFHGCRSILQKPAHAFFRERIKFILSGCARCLHCCLNSAPALCNLFIALAAGACFEIVEPITGENQMGMRVNESRQHHASTRVDDFRLAIAEFFNLPRFADVRDPAAGRHKSSVRNNS